MRSHYELASQNVHAAPKGILFRLGLMQESSTFLAGSSNAGFVEPGQNLARTLTQLTTLLLAPIDTMDSIVSLSLLIRLRDEITTALVKAERKLKKDDQLYRASKS